MRSERKSPRKSAKRKIAADPNDKRSKNENESQTKKN
jgi:hypothetical protein